MKNQLKGLHLTTTEPCGLPSDVLQALETLNEFISKNPDIELNFLQRGMSTPYDSYKEYNQEI